LAGQSRAINQGPRRGRRTRVHLLMDTGMGRGGFRPEEVWPAASRVQAEKTLSLEGVFSHFSSADEADPEPTREQIRRFRAVLREFDEKGLRLGLRHFANSAATVFFPQAHLDMVRCGLLLHGLRGWPAHRDALRLRPSLSWHTRIVDVGWRPRGWTVGYNRTHRCREKSLLATLGVGYGDGYARELSGRGEVLIRGRRCPIAGRISMDYLTVDVTALADAPGDPLKKGDMATLIGADPENGARIEAEELAALAGTIPYSITTALRADMPKRYLGSSPALEEPRRSVADPMPAELRHAGAPPPLAFDPPDEAEEADEADEARSEERRVGKEC